MDILHAHRPSLADFIENIPTFEIPIKKASEFMDLSGDPKEQHPEELMVESIAHHIPTFWVRFALFDPAYMTAEIITFPILILSNIYLFLMWPLGPFLM